MENNVDDSKLLTLKEVHISKEEFDQKYKIYKKHFEDSLENLEYTNIAITGDYGIGKSTIFKSFIKNHNEYKKQYIEIAIGAYGKEFANKNDIDTTRILERQIIHQLVSQINLNYIPFSKYRISTAPTIKVLTLKLIWILFVIGAFSFSTYYAYFFNVHPNSMLFWSYLVVAVLSGFILLWISTIFIYKHISKITFKYKSLSLEVNIKNDKFSEFDNNISELVNILTQSKKNIIIFEDLDRFGNDWIFLKLRELNLIVNNYINSNLRLNARFWKRNKAIHFIYLVSTKIFNNNHDEFIKFFDISIPIIPSVSNSNSIIYFKDIFKEYLDYRNFNTLIIVVHKWFDDFRKINDLYNEFIIYWKQNENEVFSDPTSLLAFLVFKKKFPDSFRELVDYKSSLFKEYVSKQSFHIEWKNNIIDDVIESLKKSVSPNYSYYQSGFFKKWCENPNERPKINLVESKNYETYNFYEFYGNLKLMQEIKANCYFPIILHGNEISEENNYVEALNYHHKFLEWLKNQTIDISSFIKYNSLNVNYKSFELVEWPITPKYMYEESKEVQITFGNPNFFKYFKEEFSKIIKDSKQNFDTIFNKFLKNNGYRHTLSEVWVISKILEMSNKIDKNVYDKLINFLFKSISIVNYNIDYLIKIFWFVNKESKIKFIQKIFCHNKTLEFKGMLNSLDKSSLYHFLDSINHLNLNSEIENNIKNLKSTIIDISNNKGIELPYSDCGHNSLISLLNQ